MIINIEYLVKCNVPLFTGSQYEVENNIINEEYINKQSSYAFLSSDIDSFYSREEDEIIGNLVRFVKFEKKIKIYVLGYYKLLYIEDNLQLNVIPLHKDTHDKNTRSDEIIFFRNLTDITIGYSSSIHYKFYDSRTNKLTLEDLLNKLLDQLFPLTNVKSRLDLFSRYDYSYFLSVANQVLRMKKERMIKELDVNIALDYLLDILNKKMNFFEISDEYKIYLKENNHKLTRCYISTCRIFEKTAIINESEINGYN